MLITYEDLKRNIQNIKENRALDIPLRTFKQAYHSYRKKYSIKKFSSKDYYQKNKEKILQSQKIWKINNAIRFSEWRREYDRKYKKIPSVAIQNKVRYNTRYNQKLILSNKTKQCELCHSKNNIQFHHLDYNIMHRNDKWKNRYDLKDLSQKTQLLCRDCHSKLHHNPKI